MGWLVAIVLAILLYRARRELNVLRDHVETAETESVWRDGPERPRPAPASKANPDQPLITLRLQLRRMLQQGTLKEADYQALSDKIDACWVSDLKTTEMATSGELWWSSCQAGWNILTANGLVPYGPPPWRKASAAAEWVKPSAVDVGKETQTPSPQGAAAKPATAAKPVPAAAPVPRAAPVAEAAPLPQAASAPSQPTAPVPTPAASDAQTPARPAQRPPQAPAQAPAATAAAKHAWQPVEPGPVEQVLRAVSGWPRMLVPFLVQNIGWFIGAFLFLAGTVFLVTYTTGYLKAAVVFASLFAYSLFLTWSGYKLLLKKPKLATASTVLLFTGLLLVPLSISACTRLLMNAGSSPLLWTIALAAAGACLGVVYAGTQLVAGVAHRALRGRYPQVFLALAALQLGAPLVALWPSWPALAVAHLAVLAILAYGLVRLANEWLRSVFVDNRKVLFFAAGALLFAALTSFVHLTWGAAAVSLPRGYYAPYLILLCALLFYLDARFKVHTHRSAFLSRLSFSIYGLSVVAVLLAIDAPVARLLTLGMATGLYALVVWNYLTLIPLYLMLASFVALYGFAVLVHFPPAAHLLLAVPGLIGLHGLSRWACKEGADRPPARARGLARLGLASYRATLLLLVVLAAWSMAMGAPSLLAAVSALVLAAGLCWLLRAGPEPILALRSAASDAGDAGIRLRNHLAGPWLYGPVAAFTLAGFLGPTIGSLVRVTQCSLALTLTALLWTVLLVAGRRRGRRRSPAQTEVYANAALISVFLASVLAALPVPRFELDALVIATLGVGAGIMLALSLDLYVRWVFYLFLAWVGATAAAIKMSFFSGPSTGLSEILAVAAIWALLWWLDRQPDERSRLARERAWEGGPERLLWWLPAVQSGSDDLAAEDDRATAPVSPKAPCNARAGAAQPSTAVMDGAASRV